mmetsp:Transcript_11076/g.22000  ORF Transcript_11076/g.22000 Transcript_11076/m.22000 type:complete len:212 (+) Transcript_11076:3432-4067(+)
MRVGGGGGGGGGMISDEALIRRISADIGSRNLEISRYRPISHPSPPGLAHITGSRAHLRRPPTNLEALSCLSGAASPDARGSTLNIRLLSIVSRVVRSVSTWSFWVRNTGRPVACSSLRDAGTRSFGDSSGPTRIMFTSILAVARTVVAVMSGMTFHARSGITSAGTNFLRESSLKAKRASLASCCDFTAAWRDMPAAMAPTIGSTAAIGS